MKKKNTPPGNDYEIRCPRLGHQIPFSYCRSENMGSPCFKILDCWHSYFQVEEFLKEELTPEEWEKVFNKRLKPKVLTLVEMIEQARSRQDS